MFGTIPYRSPRKERLCPSLIAIYHLLRRPHSLSGVFPVGLFASALDHQLLHCLGKAAWEVRVRRCRRRDFPRSGFHPFPSVPLEIIEWTVLFGPIAFHAILGVIFARSGKVNVDWYGWNGFLEVRPCRMTGYLAVAFIFLHITSLRFGWTYLGLMPKFDTHHAASSLGDPFPTG